MIKKIISFVSSASIFCFSLTTLSPTKCVATAINQPSEILSMRSPFEKHYNNGDGTQTAFIDTAPIHYVNENGELVEIDNTIIQTDDGNYTNAKNSMNVTLAPLANVSSISAINNGMADECHLVSLDYMGYNISWDIINSYYDCEDSQAYETIAYCPIEVSEYNSQRYIETENKQLEDYINTTILPKNSSVWYKSLFDGCDINIEIKPNSIKENIVLNSREAANQKFTYYIESDNLIAELCDITYKTDSNYTFTYSPSKYDDVTSYNDDNTYNNIYNFGKRMNCYAYALQIYHQTYSQNFTVHKLMPGEIGLSLNPSCSTSTELQNYYNSITDDTDFINFVEQQMMFDSAIMGTNLQRITLSNEEQFILPTGYNESTQRIIAMNTGYNYPSNTKDFHFYVRHGNGSCEQHGGTCSTWSHKRGNNFISDTIPDVIGEQSQNITICDNNIAQLAYNADYPNGSYSETYYNTPVRFYTIQQDANVYNSWYEYNANRDRVSYVD